MKKILYIVTQAQWGGAQKYAFDLATNLDKNEFEAVVVAGEDRNGELFAKLAQKGIRTIYLKNLVRAIKPLTDFLGLLEIIKLVKKEKPDIIHFNSSKVSILGSLAIFLYKLKIKKFPPKADQPRAEKLKIIYTVHGWVFNEPLPIWQKKFYLWAEKLTAHLKDKIICVSEYDRQVAIKNNFSEKKLITIHNGLDVKDDDFFEKEKARNLLNLSPKMNGIATPPTTNLWGTRNDIKKFKVIGTIANFYPTKGLNYLIEAANLVRKKFPDILFILIGEGRQREFLNKKISQLNLGNDFKLLKIADAHQYLKAFDVFVLSSVKEGLPYTILEAMAAELPIVATRVGGIPEMIENEISGILVEPKNSQILAEKIIKILENPDLGASFAQNAKEKFKKDFSFEKMIKRTIKLYY